MESEQLVTYLLSNYFFKEPDDFMHHASLALDYFEQVSKNYVNSYSDPTPANELKTVSVPESHFSLQANELSWLEQEVNPPSDTDNYGIDLFLCAIEC